jgi:alpha-glucosidase
MPGVDGPRCGDGELPAFASGDGATLRASCGVEVTALADGVIRLRYGIAARSWVIGGVAPDLDASIGGSDGAAALCTAQMTLTIDSACRVRATLADGTVVVDNLAVSIGGDGARLDRAATAEHVYGLGERTGGLDRRGRAWTFWNTDAYDPAYGGWKPGQDPMYQSIPLEIRTTGATAVGVFTDSTRQMTIDLGDPESVTIAGARGIDQYVIAGPRMADVVRRYTGLVGRPAMPPRWALGFHQSRWGYNDAATVEAIADEYRALAIPADAIWLDIQHLRGFRTFTWDPQGFPDPQGLVARLAAKGFRVVTIEDPGIKIDPGWDVYDTGSAGGHFLRRADGSEYSGVVWPGPAAFPDFSRGATRDWWGAQVDGLAQTGVAGVWLDVNEPTTFPESGGATVPDELVVDGDGEPTTMAELHNVYAMLEARATFDALAARGERPFVLSRAGYAGIQRYAAVWTGDTPSTWDGLAQTLPMMLGLGISGVPFVGSDIGGYSGHASPELYARWIALGSISPFARAHVTNGVPGQEPWMFGDEVTDLSRARLADRYRLLPYLYSLFDDAAHTGAPPLRPLVWEFPDDPAVRELADEAMLGPFVLAAPVVTPGATSRQVYLPAGRWYELHSGAIFDGPTTITASLELAALPLYVRTGAILPSTGDAGELVLDVYPDAASSFSIYEDDGGSLAGPSARTLVSLAATPDGAQISLARTGDHAPPARNVVIRVHRVDGAVTGVDGASFIYDADDRAIVATVADAPALELAFHYDAAIADPRPPVAVTFEVHVPTDTPMSSPITVATSANAWTHVPLTWVAPGIARGSLAAPRGEWLEYKFGRGGWDTVEKAAGCVELPNRYRFGAAHLPQIDTVATWRDRC